MKKVFLALLVVVVVGSLVLGGCTTAPSPAPSPAPAPAPSPAPSPAPAPAVKPGVIDLTFACYISANAARYNELYVPWFQRIEEATNGKVHVSPYPGGSVAKDPDQYDAVASGLADMSPHWPSHCAGRFPLSQVVELPNVLPASTLAAHEVVWEIFKTTPEVQAEYPGVKVLFTQVTARNRIYTSERPVYEMEDLKGLKIDLLGIAPTGIGKALGFTPTPLMMTDMYLSLQKGVIDGVSFDNNCHVQWKTAELLKYCTECDLGRNINCIIINRDKWDSLPPDIQKQIEEVTIDVMVEKSGEWWTKIDDETGKTLEDVYGIEFIELASDEWTRWEEALEVVRTDYLEKLKAKGLPGEKVLEEVLRLTAKYGK